MSTQQSPPPSPPLRPEQRAARRAAQVAGRNLLYAVQWGEDDEAIERSATHFCDANRAWLDARDGRQL